MRPSKVDSECPPLRGITVSLEPLEKRASPDGREWWLNWAVRAGADAIGFVEATVRGNEPRIAIAYALGKASRGRGYATDATRAMLAFLAARFPGARIEATVDERNVPSLRLLERLAFAVVDNVDPRNLRLQRSPGPHVDLLCS
jgi:RimJ/RimL family protein N-acetyltransferase